MATIKQQVKQFNESTSSSQTQTLTIPGLKGVTSVKVNTGTVSYTVNGSTVTFTLSGGSYTRTIQTGGSYTPPDSKEVTTTQKKTTNQTSYSFPSSVSYNSDGYSGNLSKDGSPDRFLAWGSTGSTAVYQFTQKYRGTVTKPASDTRTYAYYYQYTVTIEYSDNSNPTTILTSPPNNQTLTENTTVNIQGTASDTDKDNVVTIKYRVNNGTTRALQSGVSNGSTPISFAKTITFRTKRLYDGNTDITGSDLAENTDHTLTIWAEDDQGGKSTEVTRKFRVVHNRPPVISGQNLDLGVLSAIPSKNYTVTEPEGDAFTIKEKVNGKIIRTFAGTASKENTATIPLDTWLQLSLTAVHTLTIEATDSKGMTSIRTYTFRRSADKIAFALKKPFDTDIAAKRILVTVDATVPAGADYKVEVCNNAFDESPTWEDTTNHVKFNRGFIFTNKEKTAEKWGVSLRFSFTKGTAAEPVIVRGFGGAFD
ncbi:Ig-like domain-containing protein [Brevibacillus laterosporus]|uniref:Ig-like domain-containing protein n=1 Tax=Brevibacillus laterosporus TaxID=1465 RepID=UPI001CA5DEBF|nr:Ig-like domain-containing protein [Brevibacillus laterosporus]MED1665070.1 Ig-like domain-containing protein [Brevibacillus laterosporus]MED1668719.1 Ig-like domain-containing protein [Brevibacillus laterosporus]MED1716404.1 Ig-like domain-containing protein [Brevibacillus laterosporus]